MDNFREWLSDNLRYFMLGGAILLIVAVLFFGVRMFVGSKKGSSDREQEVTTAQNDQGNDPSSPAKDGETDDGKKDANPMETADAEVTALIKSYYKALGEKDITALRDLEVDLPPSDETKVVNAKDYIEGYEVGDIYTKKGLTKGSYVVYVCFNYICRDIDTPVPALSQVYVITDTDGELKINGAAWQDAEISEYTEGLAIESDVRELTEKVEALYEQAQAEDEALAGFLDGLGEDASSSSSVVDGTILTVTEDCNVRAAADGEAEIIGGLPTGTEVEKQGIDGEWIQIEYEGSIGYVHNSLLE